MKYTDQEVLEMIAPSMRDTYGETKEEIISNYKMMHPEIFVDLQDRFSLLTIIMECVVEAMEGHAYALKGGYVLKVLTEKARYTQDIDMSISSSEAFKILRTGFDKAGKIFVDAGASNYSIREISERCSGGLTVNKGESTIVSADVSIQNLSYGIRLHDSKFYCYTFEKMLIDKLKATLSNKVFRRIKDLYDIHLMVSNFEIDTEELKFRLKEEGVVLTEESSPFNPNKTEQLAHAWDKFRIFEGDGMSTREKPEFKDVMRSYMNLTSHVF